MSFVAVCMLAIFASARASYIIENIRSGSNCAASPLVYIGSLAGSSTCHNGFYQSCTGTGSSSAVTSTVCAGGCSGTCVAGTAGVYACVTVGSISVDQTCSANVPSGLVSGLVINSYQGTTCAGNPVQVIGATSNTCINLGAVGISSSAKLTISGSTATMTTCAGSTCTANCTSETKTIGVCTVDPTNSANSYMAVASSASSLVTPIFFLVAMLFVALQ